MDMHSSAATRLLILGLLCAAGARAQFPQYTAPGSLAVPRVPIRERVETSAEAAQWDLGAIKLDPRIWLRDSGYNDNVFGASDEADQVSDFTATAGAGLVAFSHLGSDVILSAYLLPEYTWWQDLDQLRNQQLNYGAGIFGLFNRLTLILDGRRDERQQFLNAEALVPADIQTRQASLEIAVDFRGPFELFGSAEALAIEHAGGAAAVRQELLDRDEGIARLGLAYRFPSDLRIGLGVEYSEADFTLDPGGRSNTALGPLVEIDYETGDFSLSASAVLRDLEFDRSRDSISEPTGSLRVGWQASHRLQIDVYGGRSLVYSVAAADRFFTEERYGLSIGTPWGRRFLIRAYGETGRNRYAGVGGEVIARTDDVTSFGGQLDIELGRRSVLTASASGTEFDSSEPGLDRSVTVIRLGLRLGGDPRPW